MATSGFTVHRPRRPGILAVEADTGHRFGRHWHDQFGVGVVVAGAQASYSGRGEVEARAGDIITVNPGEIHDGRPLGDHGRAWRMLYLDPPIMAELAADIRDGRPGDPELHRPVLRDDRLAALVVRLHRTLAAADALPDADAEEALLLMVAGLDRHRDDSHRRTAPPPPVQKVIQRIDERPEASETLVELAGVIGVGRFQLLRGFQRAVGMPPHAYRIQRRLALARRRIAAGQSLAETAADCGFADQSHLTRLFVRCYGLTPGTLARAAR